MIEKVTTRPYKNPCVDRSFMLQWSCMIGGVFEKANTVKNDRSDD